MSQGCIGEIISEKRAIAADIALCLGRFFGADDQSWMNLPTHYDLEVGSDRLADKLDGFITYHQIVKAQKK